MANEYEIESLYFTETMCFVCAVKTRPVEQYVNLFVNIMRCWPIQIITQVIYN